MRATDAAERSSGFPVAQPGDGNRGDRVNSKMVAPTAESSLPSKEPTSNRRAKYGAAVALAVTFAVVLRKGALSLPFILDDFLQIAMGTGQGWVQRPPWDRSRLVSGVVEENAALVDIGRLPFWTDLKMRIAPFRPLAGLEGAVDYALHGPSPTVAHAVSLAWLGAAIVAASVLFRRALPTRAALLSTFVYASSRAHGMVVAWIANRCAILSAVFVALSLHGYLKFRDKGSARGEWQAIFCLSLALLSSEYSLGAYGFLLAYELFESKGPLRERLRALRGPLILLAVYGVAFRVLGYGARATTLYVDPLVLPGRFVRIVATNWPELVCLAFAPLRLGLSGRVIFAMGAIDAAVVTLLLFRPSAGPMARRSRWLFLGALVALVPVSVTFPQYRLLPVAELGVAGCLGSLAADAIAKGSLVPRLAVAWLAFVHLVASPIATTEDLAELRLHDFFVQASLAAPLPPDPDVDAIVLESTQVFALHYPPLVRAFANQSVPRTWRVLSCTFDPVEVRRIGPNDLELRSLGRGLLADPQAGVYREPRNPVPPVVSLLGGSFVATVLEGGPNGPMRMRYAFSRDLDDPKVALLVAGPQGFQRVFLPFGSPPIVVPGG